MDVALSNTFLDPDLEYPLVPSLRVSLDILAAGLKPKLIGPLHSGLLLETVVRCPIVKFDHLKMGTLVQLLEGSQTRLAFQAKVELDVGSALLPPLKLAIHVRAMLRPVGQVLLRGNVRVVQSAKPVV